ncbi:hypothetical protein PATA110616_02300 [Paenibacillus tarimensis]
MRFNEQVILQIGTSYLNSPEVSHNSEEFANYLLRKQEFFICPRI